MASIEQRCRVISPIPYMKLSAHYVSFGSILSPLCTAWIVIVGSL